MPNPPLLLVDNAFDRVSLYPNGVLTTSSEVVGHEARYLADYRRDRTWYQTATAAADHWVKMDLGPGLTMAPDFLFLDRGHNLWGRHLQVQTSADGTFAAPSSSSLVLLPATLATQLGGNPLTGWSVTEEGAVWRLFDPLVAARYIRILLPTAAISVITGIIVGARTQFTGYSNIFDEDASARTQRSETSDAGYRARGRTYTWREGELGFDAIGASTYDNQMRLLRARIFDRAQPFVLCMDYATNPERTWMFEFAGDKWNMAKRRVSRSGRVPIRELYHAIR